MNKTFLECLIHGRRTRNLLASSIISIAQAQDQRNYMRNQRAIFRASSNALVDLSDTEFRNRYRLTKEVFLLLCQQLKELTNLKSTQRVTVETKVLVALFFYATGSYQRPVGVAKNLSQKMCSVYIQQVTQALIHPAMLQKYIQFPKTRAARQVIIEKFQSKFGLPGVVGCIDGSHFKIFGPSTEEEHLYYCRKHFHSLNVQMVCDSDCRIINVNAKYGGANHDAFIWENSELNNYMQTLHECGEICWLLGDSGYPLRPWLMTPILDANNELQTSYNQKHGTARVLIENTFGRLKNCWRCLCKDRVLHYKPEKCAQIIQACCVLYNLALDYNILEPDTIENIEQNVAEPDMVEETGQRAMNYLLRGRALRDQLVHRLN